MTEMQKVDSSLISEVGHEDKTLTIKFKNGGTYKYQGVPEATYNKLLEAESQGEYFHEHIIGKYKHK